MASLSRDEKTGIYRVHFRYGGRQFMKSLKTTDKKRAEGWNGRIEETLLDLARGRRQLPPEADPWEWISTDGHRDRKPILTRSFTVEGLFDWYFRQQTEGGKGKTTLRIERIHADHFKRLLGVRTELPAITGDMLQQQYINARAKEKRHGKTISADTVRKEIRTLQLAWNRAHRQHVGNVTARFQAAGLKFPRSKEKPPYQTWQQIEAIITGEKPSAAKQRELWACLFLDVGQIAEVLDHVRTKRTAFGEETRIRYFHPLLLSVAHTGARLSEAIRSEKSDFNFDAGKVRIREQKRSQTKETYRLVDMSPTLTRTMQEWFDGEHPGGSVSFCRFADKLLFDQTVHDDFKWFMKKSKWAVLRGFHVFRHSFASNLARNGVDQRVIDELMGHQTEEQRKRYRHLFPQQKEHAIKQLFG